MSQTIDCIIKRNRRENFKATCQGIWKSPEGHDIEADGPGTDELVADSLERSRVELLHPGHLRNHRNRFKLLLRTLSWQHSCFQFKKPFYKIWLRELLNVDTSGN